jgi:hypothetical protein
MTDTDRLIRRFIGGDPAATADIAERSVRSDDPAVLVAAALIGAAPLGRAAALAVTTRDRQLVAIAAAHLDGDHDRVHALARDHLADHPGHLLVAWIAALHTEEKS